MFRSTITITSPGTFLSSEDFISELENYFDKLKYTTEYDIYVTNNQILNRSITLTNSNTLTIIMDWDVEASYTEFFTYSTNYISALTSAGYTRTVTTETI